MGSLLLAFSSYVFEGLSMAWHVSVLHFLKICLLISLFILFIYFVRGSHIGSVHLSHLPAPKSRHGDLY